MRLRRFEIARIAVCTVTSLLLWVASIGTVRARTESVEEKLETLTDYRPQAISLVDQLIEVARRFKIPMGIECVEKAATATAGKTLPSKKRSVRELIQEITSVAPEYRIDVADGLVRVYSPNEALHPFNFLNINLKSYDVNAGDLFAAEDQLRWAIRFTLEPEKYLYGYAGGYGHGANDVFEFPKFTLSGSHLTIRDVLDRITLAQGNALWVATIKSSDLDGDEPSWQRKGVRGDITSGWRFVPLAEIPELAKENVAVDVVIDGLLDQRMTTIPVILEYGLHQDSVGATSGYTSEGDSYHYGASVEKMGNDFVVLSIHLTVKRKGEVEFNFDEKLQVYRDRITEVRPEPRIRIRSYFELRQHQLP